MLQNSKNLHQKDLNTSKQDVISHIEVLTDKWTWSSRFVGVRLHLVTGFAIYTSLEAALFDSKKKNSSFVLVLASHLNLSAFQIAFFRVWVFETSVCVSES